MIPNTPAETAASLIKTAHAWLHTARFLTEAPQLHHLRLNQQVGCRFVHTLLRHCLRHPHLANPPQGEDRQLPLFQPPLQ